MCVVALIPMEYNGTFVMLSLIELIYEIYIYINIDNFQLGKMFKGTKKALSFFFQMLFATSVCTEFSLYQFQKVNLVMLLEEEKEVHSCKNGEKTLLLLFYALLLYFML